MEFKIEKMVERIRSLMDEQDLTNIQLAAKSGVSVHTLGKVLRMETKEPSVGLVIDVANALGVSADYLITGNEVQSISSDTIISDKEKEIIKAYKNKPEMQLAVDTLLGLHHTDRSSSISTTSNTARIAAYGGGTFDVPAPNITAEELEKLIKEQEQEDMLAEIEAEKKRKRK